MSIRTPQSRTRGDGRLAVFNLPCLVKRHPWLLLAFTTSLFAVGVSTWYTRDGDETHAQLDETGFYGNDNFSETLRVTPIQDLGGQVVMQARVDEQLGPQLWPPTTFPSPDTPQLQSFDGIEIQTAEFSSVDHLGAVVQTAGNSDDDSPPLQQPVVGAQLTGTIEFSDTAVVPQGVIIGADASEQVDPFLEIESDLNSQSLPIIGH